MNTPLDLTALRRLDAAHATHLDETTKLRAEARLHQILISGIEEPSMSSARRRTAPRSTIMRRAVLLAAVAALTLTAVLVDLGDTRYAYASWASVPTSLSIQDKTTADRACRGAGLDLDAPSLALSERRGDWLALLYTSTEPMVTACMTYLPPGFGKAQDVELARAGGQGAVPGAEGFTQGSIFQFGGDSMFGLRDRPTISLTHGDVGKRVKALAIIPAHGKEVQATIHDGHYVAWWPGSAFGSATEDNGGPAPSFSYRTTLDDQTVTDDAQPTRPK
ncbi:hypothetical protein ACIBCT_39875 [Streptosporangium sp. NPDC050855]|uniref:hypothetical protein n=1 Tax=Streptosporangium sp. NPDC050855 TaxID=3366194 RepID=UPI00378E00D8